MLHNHNLFGILVWLLAMATVFNFITNSRADNDTTSIGKVTASAAVLVSI